MAKSRNVANLIAANLLPGSNTIQTSMIVDGAITSSKLAVNAVTTSKLDSTVVATLPMTITAVYITDGSYINILDQAVVPGGGYIRIIGTGFLNSAQIYFNNTPALSSTYVSSTELRAQVPSLSSGYYHIYIQNTTNGMSAVRVNGLLISSSPSWVTSATQYGAVNAAFSLQLVATSDTALTYTLNAGSSLPPGLYLNSNGLLSGTVTGIGSTTTYSVNITVTDTELQKATQSFTLTFSVSEPNFYQNALLVQGNSYNAVTNNNTFVDSSVTGLGITRTGNVAQGTNGPFNPNGWSNYFNGSTDYLSITSSNNAFTFGTGDFTFESWIYYDGSISIILDARPGGGNWQVFSQSNQLVLFTSAGQNGLGTIPTNQWTHIALTRSSGIVYYWINGTLAGTWSMSNSMTGGTTPNIGTDAGSGGSTYLKGYISNLRVLNNTALYTANFTPSTTALTSVANTSVLTCAANRFIDLSSNNLTITPSGSPRVEAFEPFAPGSSWVNSVHGASSYFDGSGDYLTVNPSSLITIGTSSATVEFWIYPTAVDGYRRIVTSTAGNFTSGTFCIRYNNGTFGAGAMGGNFINSSTLPRLNQWNHVAWVGTTGTSQALYINGNVAGTSTTYNITESINFVGGYFSTGPAEFFAGYIGDLRVMKGTALFTGNFTVPSAPLTRTQNASANVLVSTGATTTLLLNHTNFGIFDATSKNNLETIGPVATQTTYFKYGGGALNFTGNSYITMASTPILSLGTGPFTIEAWVYLTGAPGNNICYTIASNYTGTTGSARYWWLGITTGTAAAGGFVTSGTGSITFATTVYGSNNASIYATPTWTYNQWNHIAVVRDASNNFYIFFNGQSQTTATAGANASWSNSTDFTVTAAAAPNMIIGAQPSNSPAPSYFAGYIDDLRISKFARYTANFTPPESDLPTQ